MNLPPVYLLLLTFLNGAVDARVGNVNTLYNSDDDNGRRNNGRHALIGTRERKMYDIDEKVKKNNIPSKSKYDRVEETDDKFYRGDEIVPPPSSNECPCFTSGMLVKLSDEGIEDYKSCHEEECYYSTVLLSLNKAFTTWGNDMDTTCQYPGGKLKFISNESAEICKQLIVDRCYELSLTPTATPLVAPNVLPTTSPITKLPTPYPSASPTATPSVAPNAMQTATPPPSASTTATSKPTPSYADSVLPTPITSDALTTTAGSVLPTPITSSQPPIWD